MTPAALERVATGILQAESLSDKRQAHLRISLADAATRAGEHFQTVVQQEDGPLPDALAAWAKAQGLQGVVALRPAVGPLHALATPLRARLAREGVALHLVWRPEDAATLPLARAGYFAFWQGARAQLLGQGTDQASVPTAKPHRQGKDKRRRDRRGE